MRSIITIVVCLAISCSNINAFSISGRMLVPKYENLEQVTTGYFKQILDHFDNSSVTYWNQLYFFNDQYWKEDGPVFLMIGGEGAAEASMLAGGAWVDWAKKYGALLMQLEHRYYGQSMPTSDASTENLQKYLSSKQALADIAYFIDEKNQDYNLTSSNKWITFGGSYPGNLVAWSRLVYPDRVYGGISSSGPLQAEVDFYQYYDVVRKSLDYFYPGCSKQVTKAIKTVQSLWTTSNGMKRLASRVNVCDDFNRKKVFDRALFVQDLTSKLTDAVQYNKQQDDNSIDDVCKYMMNSSIPHPLDRLSKYYSDKTNDSCISASYSSYVSYLKSDKLTDQAVTEGSRTWIFQTCNEFGYYQTSETKKSFLLDTMPVNQSTQLCTDVFGPEFNPNQLDAAIKATNDYYGGDNINVDRVVFIQNSADPWHALGQVKNPTEEDPFYLAIGTSHCYDMLSPSADDPPSITAARNGADEKLGEWLDN